MFKSQTSDQLSSIQRQPALCDTWGQNRASEQTNRSTPLKSRVIRHFVLPNYIKIFFLGIIKLVIVGAFSIFIKIV